MDKSKQLMIQTILGTVFGNTLILVVLYVVLGDALQGKVALFFGIGIVLSLILGFVAQMAGKKTMEPEPEPAEAPKAIEPVKASPDSALQVLSLLQRKGRLIDFLQEDLSQFQDAQIGAAVRNIHEGCKQVLAEYVKVEPIYGESEGSDITVQAGFDAQAVRLVGNVSGEPPFKGALRHRGWRVVEVELPERVGQEQSMILAAAEVEVNG